MRKATLFVLFIFCSPVVGGGDAYLVAIESLGIDSKGFFVKLSVPDTVWYEDNCTTVQVSGKYDSEKWQRYGGLPMNLKFHEDALKMLSNAHKESRAVMFGPFGGGLHKIANCKYLSKGLFSEGEYIFSIYGNI